MASLTLKNIPEDLLAALRRTARKDRRSLTQQIIHLLEVAVRGPGRAARTPPDVEAQLAAWRKLAGRWESDVDLVTEARRIRERRTGGREVDL